MGKKKFMHSIIETAVKRGLNYIVDNPKRGIRNLLDLGEYFSSGRSQKSFFDIAHEILNNEESFYYDIIEDTVKNTNHDTLTNFGINLGYNSFTYGSEIIKRKEKILNNKLPWIITFDFRQSALNHISTEEIMALIEEGKACGIYSYIFLLDNNDILKYLYPVFEKNDDCAFPVIITSKIMSEEHSKNMNNMHNICFLVHVGQNMYNSEIELEDCIHYLREENFLYGACCYYDESNYKNIIEATEDHRNLKIMKVNFALLLQKHDNENYNPEVAKIMYNRAYKSRFQSNSPTFLVDFYGDIDSVGTIISESDKGSNILSINSDGQICSHFLRNETKYNIGDCKLKNVLSILST